MSELNVRVVELAPMRVVCFHGYGRAPESIAFGKLVTWAKANGYLVKEKPCRLFGFNHPDPSPGTPNYGYEVWMTVEESFVADGKVKLHDFPGGLYGVIRCDVKDPYTDIPAAWKQLVTWREKSRYQKACHQWLEENINPLNLDEPEFVLDLYLPIAE